MYKCTYCHTVFNEPELIDDYKFGCILPEKGWNLVCPCCHGIDYYKLGEDDEN